MHGCRSGKFPFGLFGDNIDKSDKENEVWPKATSIYVLSLA
jgi:hypothetical protein